MFEELKKYTHYKNGNVYTVTGVRTFKCVTNSLDGMQITDYKDEDGVKYCRFSNEFHGSVWVDGYFVPRYKLITDEKISVDVSDRPKIVVKGKKL
jgi:hypothetical protein